MRLRRLLAKVWDLLHLVDLEDLVDLVDLAHSLKTMAYSRDLIPSRIFRHSSRTWKWPSNKWPHRAQSHPPFSPLRIFPSRTKSSSRQIFRWISNSKGKSRVRTSSWTCSIAHLSIFLSFKIRMWLILRTQCQLTMLFSWHQTRHKLKWSRRYSHPRDTFPRLLCVTDRATSKEWILKACSLLSITSKGLINNIYLLWSSRSEDGSSI